MGSRRSCGSHRKRRKEVALIMDSIALEDFKKLQIKIGRIEVAEMIEGADKLLRLEVNLGDERRQIVSGIAQFYKPSDLIGKECPFIVNLEPRKFMGVESQGMLMATGVDGSAVLLHPDKEVPEGSLLV